ncbi:hypothetical protein TNCV_1808861 [Trichonephila clavipes]|nr:hypothetical protein TNCV_1808861 [Trichonephila clavipes]
MLGAYESEGTEFCPPDIHLNIGDLDTQLRKTQHLSSCPGAIYPPQEQSKVVKPTCRNDRSRQTHLP